MLAMTAQHKTHKKPPTKELIYKMNSHKARMAELKVDRQTAPDTLKRIIAILLRLLTVLAQNIRKFLSRDPEIKRLP